MQSRHGVRFIGYIVLPIFMIIQPLNWLLIEVYYGKIKDYIIR